MAAGVIPNEWDEEDAYIWAGVGRVDLILEGDKAKELKALLDIALNIEPNQKPAWALWLADRL